MFPWDQLGAAGHAVSVTDSCAAHMSLQVTAHTVSNRSKNKRTYFFLTTYAKAKAFTNLLGTAKLSSSRCPLRRSTPPARSRRPATVRRPAGPWIPNHCPTRLTRTGIASVERCPHRHKSSENVRATGDTSS